MNDLDIRKYILDTDADKKHYFTSLVSAAREKGLMSEAEYSMLQEELLLILADRTFRYNDKKSTSVTVATAKELLNSVIYTVGLALKQCPTPDEAVRVLKRESLKKLYEDGLAAVKKKLNVSRSLQKHLLNRLVKTENKFIRACVEDELNEFFESYSPEYFAHGGDLWFAYEPYTGFPELCGIEFIEQYLRDAEAENSFCLLFDRSDLHHLLCGVAADYPLIPMNIFEPAIFCVLGLLLCGKAPDKLDLTSGDVALLHDTFLNRTEEETAQLLLSAAEKLPEHFTLEENVKSYILRCIPKLSLTLVSAVRQGITDKVFIRQAFPENSRFISLSRAPRMSDADYRMMISKLLLLRDPEQRVSLILSSVSCAEDLIDAVHDGELVREEIDAVADRLGFSEFVILLSKLGDTDFGGTESDRLLYEALERRKKELSENDLRQVKEIIRALADA